MSLRTYTAAIALSLLVLLCGCGANDVCSPANEFLCYASSLEVPDSVDVGQTIDAMVSGFAGHGCDHLHRIESEMVGHKWILRPIAHHVEPPRRTVCTRQMVYFERTVPLKPSGTGWAYVEVQSSGPTLFDSTYVRP